MAGARLFLAIGGELGEALLSVQGDEVAPGLLVAALALEGGAQGLDRGLVLAASGV